MPEIRRMKAFFMNSQEFLYKFSKRNGKGDNYCRYTPTSYDNLKRFTRENSYTSYNGRYSALNLQNSNTIEIRIFRGTLKEDRFKRSLELVDAISHFVKLHGFNAMNWNNFRRYIVRENRYTNLSNYLEKENL